MQGRNSDALGGIVTCFENIATLGLFLRNDNLIQSVDCLVEAFLIS